jgi:hypothetical protein
MHGFCGQQDGEFHEQLSFGADGAQIELAAPLDHVLKHDIKCELIFARPLRHQFPYFGPIPPNER